MFRLATWNINSVRLRAPLIKQFTEKFAPDVLCLQETKCEDAKFPFGELQDMGYAHIRCNGQKSYHGVAILSRHPLLEIESLDFCDTGEARHISARIALGGGKRLEIHNFYVPAGGDEPNPEANPKFRHKLDYLEALADWGKRKICRSRRPVVMVGDLNVAPLKNDVWSHKQLSNVVSHTPVEIDLLDRAMAAGCWTDAVRTIIPPEERLFTWWSYRAKDWRASNRGRRLDHIWHGRNLNGIAAGIHVFDGARDWQKPSDHVPVLCDFDFSAQAD